MFEFTEYRACWTYDIMILNDGFTSIVATPEGGTPTSFDWNGTDLVVNDYKGYEWVDVIAPTFATALDSLLTSLARARRGDDRPMDISTFLAISMIATFTDPTYEEYAEDDLGW